MIHLSGYGPLGRQVYLAIREAVTRGEIASGTCLPSTRALAADLAVSRTVTQGAYDQLIAEGYLTARIGSGTYVTAELTRDEVGVPPASIGEVRLSRAGTAVLERNASLYSSTVSQRGRMQYDFRTGLPPLGDFPHEKWRRLLTRQARRTDMAAHDYGPPAGTPELREAIAAYLRRARALACTPEQVIVVHGSQQGLDLTARLLVDAGEDVAIEDPGYEGARNAFAFCGARVVPVTVDGSGLDVSALARTNAKLVYVTPSHQFPTGAVLSMSRRSALLEWAQRTHATIIEDDYDGEFRFDARPIAPLQSLDRHSCVIYLGTFSKVMFPSLRIGYLIVPPSLIRAYVRAKPLVDGGGSPLVQNALADFLSDGGFELYVRRLRRRMAERRDALLESLDRRLAHRAEVLGANAGLHVLLRLCDMAAETVDTVVRNAASRGVGVYSATPYYVSQPKVAELVLGYAALTPAGIREGIRRLDVSLRELD